jgi:hypothetical protein
VTLEVQAAIVAHAIRIAAILPEPDAQQDVVGVVIVRAEEVRIVCRDHAEADVLGEPEHLGVQLGLPLGLMGLHFQEIPVGKGVRVPARGRLCVLVPPFHEVGGHLAREAGRGDDQSLGVLGEQLPVDARLGVEALRVRERRQLDEVPVPDGVLGEEYQVVIWLRTWCRPGAKAAIPRRDVRLHADDRLDAGLLGLLLKAPGRVEIAVVGDCQRRLLELERALYEVIDPVRPVQQRILGVTVQMDEGHRTGNIATPQLRRKADQRLSRSVN